MRWRRLSRVRRRHAYNTRQLGHKNTSILLKHYARWIDGADKGAEAAKVNQAFGPTKPGGKGQTGSQ
jgi:hypothetical protein